MEEQWKLIEGFEGRYSVSNLGRVKQNDITYISLQNKVIHHEEKIIEPCIWQSRYLRINICSNKKNNKHRLNTYLHKLVAEYFIGPRPEGYVIDHINGNYLDNRAENLRYVTRKENVNNPNTKPKISKGVKEAYKNPDLRQLVSERTKEAMWRPEVHCKLGSGVRGKPKSEEHKNKIIESLKNNYDRINTIKETLWRPEVHCKLGSGVRGKHKVWDDKENNKYHYEF